MLAYSRSFLVDALIDLGGLGAAREVLAGLAVDEDPPIGAFVMLRCVRARLRRIEGDAGGAARELLAAGRDLGAMAPVFWRWRAEAAVALHHARELARARARAAEAVDEARVMQSNWALAEALRAQAPAEDEIDPLRQAEAATRDLPILLERAHVLTDLGAALRRGHRIEALFVSLRTDETHLTRGYDTLGIRGRKELTTAMFTAPSVAIRALDGLEPRLDW